MQCSSRIVLGLSLGLLVLVGCGSDKPTAVGEVVIEWDRSKSERDNIKSAKAAGDVIAHKKLVKAAGAADKLFTVELDFDITPLSVVEDGKTARHSAPTKVRAKVASNDFWTLSGTCEGPHYQMPDGGKTAEAMVLDCNLKMRHGEQHDEVLPLQIYGDGNINAVGNKVSIDDRK